MFLRNYVDELFYRQKPDRRKRKRVYDDSHFATGERTAPLNAPRWTKSGYNGSMRELITKTIQRNSESSTLNELFSSKESVPENLIEKEPNGEDQDEDDEDEEAE